MVVVGTGLVGLLNRWIAKLRGRRCNKVYVSVRLVLRKTGITKYHLQLGKPDSWLRDISDGMRVSACRVWTSCSCTYHERYKRYSVLHDLAIACEQTTIRYGV